MVSFFLRRKNGRRPSPHSKQNVTLKGAQTPAQSTGLKAPSWDAADAINESFEKALRALSVIGIDNA